MLRWKLNALSRKSSGGRFSRRRYQWSSQSFTLRQILTRFKLPCVVMCCYESCPIEWSEFQFDLSQPLLLHSSRDVQKLYTRCVRKCTTSGQPEEFGPSLVIPEDYDGWFYFMKNYEDRPVKHKTVGSVSQSQATKFYVNSSLSCLTTNKIDEKKTLDSARLNSREIIRRCNVIDNKTLRKSYRMAPNVLTGKELDSSYVVFKDEKDDEVILGCSESGMFYEIYENSDDDSGVVRPISDVLLRREAFPLTIRHVIGELPALTSGYTGVLHCVDIRKEDTVLACTMDSRTKIPMELQIDSPFKFKICLNESQMKQTDHYNDALKICDADGESYVRGMKLAFNVTPTLDILSSLSSLESEAASMDRPETSRTIKDLPNVEKESCAELNDADTPSCYNSVEELDEDIPSCYDTGSDVEEEDAQSEFSFRWSPKENSRKQLNGKSKPPKVFNSSILSLASSKASIEKDINVWNENPDVV